MSGGLPRWSVALLRALSSPGELDDVLGDLDEARRHRLWQRGGPARLATAIDTLDMAMALVRARVIRARIHGSTLMQDYKLGLRMLAKYPGLTIAGGLALAIAIGVGAAWFDVTRQMWRPTIPLPEGDRIVEIEMRDPRKNGDEHRIIHDFLGWRRAARSVTDLGAYRTVQRNLVIGDARLEPVTAAEIRRRRWRSPTSLPSWDARCSKPTSGPARHRSWSSATRCGSGSSADAPASSDSRSKSGETPRPSSASCPKALPSPSTIASGRRSPCRRPGICR